MLPAAAPGQSQRTLQTLFKRRIAALNVRWKLAMGHWCALSEWTTTEILRPAKANSTFGSALRSGSPCQDLSNSTFSTGLLNSATNLCMKTTSFPVGGASWLPAVFGGMRSSPQRYQTSAQLAAILVPTLTDADGALPFSGCNPDSRSRECGSGRNRL